MSYEHGTPHYNLPQTVGSDTRDWFDTNEAFADIDAAIYSAGQTAETAAQDLDGVKSDVQSLKDADIAMTGRVDGIEGRVGASEQAITRLQQDVADVDTDLMDAICAIKEASATAAYQHLTGTFFWYNDTLYKATADIGVGNQIVPDTNCSTTNITTELLAGGGGVEIDDTVISATKVWSSQKVNSELQPSAGDVRFSGGKLQQYDGTDWVDISIGGSGMLVADFNSYATGSSSGGGSFTAQEPGFIVGTAYSSAGTTQSTSVTVNGVTVSFQHSTAGSDSTGYMQCYIPYKTGDAIAITGSAYKCYKAVPME